MGPGFAAILGFVYLSLMLMMIVGCVYLLIKVGEISRSVAAITGQQESQSRSLAYLAESVATLAKAAAAPNPEPPGRLED